MAEPLRASGQTPFFSRGDVIAGVSVALIGIPQAMAYAELAGLPAHHGLYAAALPPLAAAFFASSRYLQTGPVAVTSLLTLGALSPLVATGSARYVAMAALLALVVGLARVALGFLRAGAVAFLLSEPVLMGFTTGAALLIIFSQLPGALGVVAPLEGVVGRAFWAMRHVEAWEVASLGLAAMTVLLIVGSRRVHPLVPGVLLATLVGLGYSLVAGYEGPRLGTVPTGLPPIELGLPWSTLPLLIVPGIVIALVGFAEPASIARTFAAQERQPWNPSREFVSQGVANLVSGISGGFPVGGSFSRSSLNRLAGAKTRWSGAVKGLAVLLFLPFAFVLSPLPRAVLSAIVIAAVLNLVRLRALAGLWRLSKPQAVVAWFTFLMTLGLAPRVDQAVLLGILFAGVVHFWRELTPTVRSWTDEDTLHLEPRGVLWFGSAPGVESAVVDLLSKHTGLERVVIHMGGLGRVDLTGALTLKRLLGDMSAAGIEAELADVPPHAFRILGRCLGWRPDRPQADTPTSRSGL